MGRRSPPSAALEPCSSPAASTTKVYSLLPTFLCSVTGWCNDCDVQTTGDRLRGFRGVTAVALSPADGPLQTGRFDATRRLEGARSSMADGASGTCSSIERGLEDARGALGSVNMCEASQDPARSRSNVVGPARLEAGLLAPLGVGGICGALVGDPPQSSSCKAAGGKSREQILEVARGATSGVGVDSNASARRFGCKGGGDSRKSIGFEPLGGGGGRNSSTNSSKSCGCRTGGCAWGWVAAETARRPSSGFGPAFGTGGSTTSFQLSEQSWRSNGDGRIKRDAGWRALRGVSGTSGPAKSWFSMG